MDRIENVMSKRQKIIIIRQKFEKLQKKGKIEQ